MEWRRLSRCPHRIGAISKILAHAARSGPRRGLSRAPLGFLGARGPGRISTGGDDDDDDDDEVLPPPPPLAAG